MIGLALSWLSGLLPWLWVLPAAAAAGLWLYGYFQPTRLAAEIVSLGSMGLGCLAVYLLVWSGATAACLARVEAATAAETARQTEIVGDALTEAQEAATAATTAREEAEARLATVLDEMRRTEAPLAAGAVHGGGLSPTSVETLRRLRGGK